MFSLASITFYMVNISYCSENYSDYLCMLIRLLVGQRPEVVKLMLHQIVLHSSKKIPDPVRRMKLVDHYGQEKAKQISVN